MGSSGSKQNVVVEDEKVKSSKASDYTKDEIEKNKVPYSKNFNLRGDSDYDDEIDSFAGKAREEMINVCDHSDDEEDR